MTSINITLLLAIIAVVVSGQENAQTRIPNSLLECYEDPVLLLRDNRLPNTLNTFLDIIRKVENDPTGKNMDMRVLTISLLHRFRLDGIVRARTISASNNVVPYSPQRFLFHKHKLLLTNFIPGNAITFPNASLTPMERCSFHHMISETIEDEARGDEATVCNKLSQYRTQRLPREAPDVEMMNLKLLKNSKKSGNMKMDNEDGVDTGVELDISPGVYGNEASEPVSSQCPVETGVIRTTWGTISAGTLLAGIAAGLQPQTVRVREILPRAGADTTLTSIPIDNRFAATLSGDLAEVALLQGPNKDSKSSLSVGAGGGWNSTTMPKWYFLSQSKDYEYTDAEIRGGLDGLILGMNIKEFQSKAPNMKLSQLIDMYYSQRGVFSNKYRACNRQLLLNEVAPSATLKAQTIGFSYFLDNVMQMPGTIKVQGFTEYSENAVDSLIQYIPKSLNDLTCAATESSTLNYQVEAATDLIMALDASWPHYSIIPALAALVDSINVSPKGSSVFFMNARDGSLVVNQTNSITTFHENYNMSVHQQMPTGFELPKLLEKVKQIVVERMNMEKQLQWHGGLSTIVLVIVNTVSVSDSDISFAIDQLKIMSEQIPDVRFIYLVSGARERFENLVKEPAKDIITMSTTSDSTNADINKVVERIKDIPRRIINYRCAANWSNEDTGSNSLTEFVAPTMINYYKLHPNYFYKERNNQLVGIQGSGVGTLNVCYSRSVELPRKTNSSLGSEGVTCESVTSNKIEINLEKACKDAKYIHRCEPLYISVEGASLSGAPRCTEIGCKYPDNIRYSINLQDLGCYSGGNYLINNIFVLLIPIFILLKTLF